MERRSHDWCFTMFDEKFDGLNFDEHMNYLVFQIELCPETKKEHAQGYIEFKNKAGLNILKKRYGNDIHWEFRKGTKEQARAYCMKEESRIRGPFEFGEFYRQGKRNDLTSLYKSISSGKSMFDIVNQHPTEFIKYHNGIEKMRAIIERKNSEGVFRKLHVEYIWGPAGAGKTRSIMKLGDVYKMNKPQNGIIWWDGYESQKRILIDDYDGWISDTKLLDICDGYENKLKIHGGFVDAKYTEVYFTSNDPFESTIPQTPQMLRRITKVTPV